MIVQTSSSSTEAATNTEVVGPECHGTGSVLGRGFLSSGIAFLGMGPAREDMRSGKPFSGPSGRLLDSVLKSLGIDRDEAYFTNIACKWSTDEDLLEEFDKCRPRLDNEMRNVVKPKVVVLLGSNVAEYIIGGVKFSKMRGAVQWYQPWHCYVMPTYHPSAILHGSGSRFGGSRDDRANTYIYDLVRDIAKLRTIVTWPPNAVNAEVKYTVVSDAETAQSILDELPRDGVTPVALDVETASPSIEEINVFKDRLLCLGISTPTETWVFTPEAYRDPARPLKFPDDPNIRWTMQNALFDVQVIKRELGTWIDVKEDTMLMSYSLDERPGVHSLKTLAREYLGAGFWEEARKVKGKTDWANMKPETLHKYNAHDVAYTARLALLFDKRQREDGVRSFYERLLIPAVNAFKEIQLHGCAIDKKLHQQFAVEWGETYLAAEDELIAAATEAGWPEETPINLNSPPQLKKLLYTIIGLPGGPSTDQKQLELLRGTHPFIDKLIAFRHLAHMYDVYIIGLGKQIQHDGRVHAIIKLHGTVTGRFAYTKPPLMTIPRPYKFKGSFGRLRELFIPTEEDSVIIEADYGKAEIYMAQSYSGDPVMLDDLTRADYHSNVAAATMHKPLDEVTPEDRRKAKLVTFGVLYGREARSLAEGIQVTVPEAQQYINNFFKRYPEYTKFYRETQRKAQREGELVSATGRKRRLIFIGSGVRTLKQAVNFPIQSTTADCTLASILKLHAIFRARPELRAYILFTVHDSIIFQCHNERRDEVLQIIHDVMTTQHYAEQNVPRLPVEIKYGKSWGTTKKWHDCADERSCLHEWYGSGSPAVAAV